MKKFLIITTLFVMSLAFAGNTKLLTAPNLSASKSSKASVKPNSIQPGGKCSIQDGANICQSKNGADYWCDPVEGKCVKATAAGQKCAGHPHECGQNGDCGPQGVCVKVDHAQQHQMDMMKLQMQIMGLHKKIMSLFNMNDLQELRAAFQPSLNAALGSKDFDAGIDKLGDAVSDMAQAFANKIEVSKDLHAKLTKAVKMASSEFDKIVRSRNKPAVQGETYIMQVVKSGLQGLQKGLSGAKISAKKSSSVVKAEALNEAATTEAVADTASVKTLAEVDTVNASQAAAAQAAAAA